MAGGRGNRQEAAGSRQRGENARLKAVLQREIAPVLVEVQALAGQRTPHTRTSRGDVTEAEKEGKLVFCFCFH